MDSRFQIPDCGLRLGTQGSQWDAPFTPRIPRSTYFILLRYTIPAYRIYLLLVIAHTVRCNNDESGAAAATRKLSKGADGDRRHRRRHTATSPTALAVELPRALPGYMASPAYVGTWITWALHYYYYYSA